MFCWISSKPYKRNTFILMPIIFTHAAFQIFVIMKTCLQVAQQYRI